VVQTEAGFELAVVVLDPSADLRKPDELGQRCVVVHRGDMPWADYIADYVSAVAVGVVFRYFASAHRDGSRMWCALVTVAKADLLSVSPFELALIVWLALISRVIFPGPRLRPDSPVFWFVVQIGLITGFFAAWPVTLWLIHRGVKAESPTTPQ
jgi:hypothetical protein